jgi:hypothetical protein
MHQPPYPGHRPAQDTISYRDLSADFVESVVNEWVFIGWTRGSMRVPNDESLNGRRRYRGESRRIMIMLIQESVVLVGQLSRTMLGFETMAIRKSFFQLDENRSSFWPLNWVVVKNWKPPS